MQAGRGKRLAYIGLVFVGCWLLMGIGGAFAADPPEYELRKSFGPDGTPLTGFGIAGPVAVDQQSGAVYVVDRGTESLLKFDAEGAPTNFGGAAPYISGNVISGLSFLPVPGENQVAVDSTSHTVYVTSANTIRAFEADGEPSEFTAGPGVGTSAIGGFTRLAGAAVDSNGFIYASDRDAGTVTVFAPSGEQVTQFEAATAATLAVGATGTVYVNRALGTILDFTPSSFPVTAATTYVAAAEVFHSVDSYTVAVDPVNDDVYIAQTSLNPKIVVYDKEGQLLTTLAGPGEDGEITSAEGLAIEGSSNKLFVGNTPNSGLSQVEIFGPITVFEGPPSIDAVSARDVTADSAGLRARINPNTSETVYHFEYGLEDCSVSVCTQIPLGGKAIGSGHDPVTVTQAISGLQSGTTYHYRVVAENSFDPPTEGEDRSFTTQGGALDLLLADSRVWEMVSPADKHGAFLGLLEGFEASQFQAAANGDGFAYLTAGSIETDPAGNRLLESSTALARRSEAGWHSRDITLPNSRLVPLGVGLRGEYKQFSPDLSVSLVEPRDGPNLSPEASERAPNLRQNTDPPAYKPLVTGKEGFANVPPGTVFGGEGTRGGVQVQGANADLDYVVMRSIAPLVAGAAVPSLYGWGAGELEPVSVLPADEGGAVVAASFLGAGPSSVSHAISDGGSRVFWTAENPGAVPGLYLRDVAFEESMRIDVPEPGASGPGVGSPEFQGASADGTVVFFTDSRQLTEDASLVGRDLYRCEIPEESPLSGCSSLTNLTGSTEVVDESAEVQGLVPGISDDGASVYFIANAVLSADLNQAGKGAIAGEPNLYLWEEGEGLRFIATLSIEDRADWGTPGTSPNRAASLSAAGSPSGRYFAFMSELSLTGVDNLDAVTAEPVEQLFRYDAVTDRLDCVSCNPTGAAPNGRTTDSEKMLVDPRGQWTGRLVAATLPEPSDSEVGGNSLYRPRAVLDNGRVFFNGADSLVPADSNGQWDVYQFEDIGFSDCSASSGNAAVSRSGQGCVSLLSSGAAEGAAAFLDASISGDDVFFLSGQRLSALDQDDEVDIYDARVNGKMAVLEPATECLGAACRPAISAEADPVPSSATFNGPGNVKAKRCPKSKRKVQQKGKTRCVPRKHQKQKQAGRQKGGNR
jgi:hypothetical protein